MAKGQVVWVWEYSYGHRSNTPPVKKNLHPKSPLWTQPLWTSNVNNYTKTILWTLKWNPHIKHLLTFLGRMHNDTCKITFYKEWVPLQILWTTTQYSKNHFGTFWGLCVMWETSSIFMNEFWDFYIHMLSRVWMQNLYLGQKLSVGSLICDITRVWRYNEEEAHQWDSP